MDQRNLHRLEYHKIIDRLKECTTFGISRDIAGKLQPITDADKIFRWQQETTEAKELLRCEPELPTGGLRDIRQLLRKVEVGGILEPSELLEAGDMLFAMRRLKAFFREKTERYPIVGGLTVDLCALRELEDRIRDSIEPGGEVADNASPELRRLRSRIREMQAALKEKMEAYTRSSEFQKYLQDPIVTMRGDRYVVPVKQEYRGQFPGIIHDQSASGATMFIEPMPVVEKNNELRRAAAEEHQEIIRILTELTNRINAHMEEIRTGVETAGDIDFILAKGKLSQLLDGGEPKITREQKINFKGARHPLIKGKAVPISVWLGTDFGILVITGPNTGGKTVALKTVGLLVLMAQSGLHIPAEAGSETGIFRKIFADIGDEQSIEQSLSTFSSHMNNIIGILREVDDESLVLVDELGAGTDPTEGAALAMSILDHLNMKNVKVIATTHYSELKAYAFNKAGVENASVEFDIKTLRPTYRLNIGQPGSSSAFEIAARLGLPEEIIDVAKQSLTQEDIQVTDLIRELEDNRRTSEIERRDILQLRKETEKLKEEFQAKLIQLSERRTEVMEKARAEANEFLRKTRLEAEELIDEIKELRAKGAEQQTLSKAHDARSRLRKLKQEDKLPGDDGVYGDAPKKVRPGQEVYLPRYNQQGIIISGAGKDGSVLVQVGVMKLTVPITQMRLQKTRHISETGAAKVMAGKAKEITTEVDLRGYTVDEATETVEKYLDDAYLAGLPKAFLIHGKGTGALRKAITDLLSGHRYVKNYRLGEYGEGGTGVTVVELK